MLQFTTDSSIIKQVEFCCLSHALRVAVSENRSVAFSSSHLMVMVVVAVRSFPFVCV